MKTTKRFFAFGCSYTNWIWPTWADIVATHFDEYYNYGMSGRGNWYIYNMFLNADKQHKFTKDDLIVIQWSEWTRHDVLINGKWARSVSEEKYDNDNLNRGLICMQSANIMLKQLGCEHYVMTLNDFHPVGISDISDQIHHRILESYQDIIDNLSTPIRQHLNVNRPLRLYNGVEIHDLHPVPSEHIELINLKFPQYAPTDIRLGKILNNQLAQFLREGQVDKFRSSNDGSTVEWKDVKWHIDKKSAKQGLFGIE
jgi:hypothetical protein